MKKNLIIVPARKNSVRLPHKNMKVFHGKPLICWTLDLAQLFLDSCDVVVTTDDESIINLRNIYSKFYFLNRPDILCTSSANSIDVIFHALESIETQYDSVILLQPTSPLRSEKHLREALHLFNSEQKLKQVVSVFKLSVNTGHIVYQANDGFKFIFEKDSSDLLCLNGAIYISDIVKLKKEKSFFSKDTLSYIMPEEDSVDIDNIEDWNKALFYFKKIRGHNV